MDFQELPPTYTWTAARSAGLTPDQIKIDGTRVSRGAYVSRAVPLTLAAACRSVRDVVPTSASFSHLTAAALLGAPVAHEWPLSITVPPGAYRPRRRRLKVHVRDLLDEDTTLRHGLRMTSGCQTWLDLACLLVPEELVAVGDALYRGGHLDSAALQFRLVRAGGSRGIVEARRCAGLLTPLAASRPESLFRYWLIASDLPTPEVQVPVLDRWGNEVAHADLGYRRWKVAIEYEGRQHAERRQFGRDLERYSLMAAGGWLTLRFDAPHLHRRAAVVERVAAALRSRGARW
jgi:hypothetical protein